MSKAKRSPLAPGRMMTVVITGSTRGIGLGMASAFLEEGHQVVVSGRNKETVDAAALELSRRFPADRIRGFPCNVTRYEQVRSLWEFAVSCWRSVDIWINNAGIGQAWKAFWDLEEAEWDAVIRTNVQGSINGAHVAMKGMLAQGHGWIFNMEGFGSRGRLNPRMVAYGTSKSAVRYFSRAMVQAAEMTPVRFGTLSPGMVVTDFLLDPLRGDAAQLEEAKKIFNILADRVDAVAPFLVRGILKAKKNGAHIAWLTPAKAMTRFLFAPFSKRDLFS